MICTNERFLLLSAIAFTLYNIAKHPDVQRKILAECQDVFGDDLSAAVTTHDLNNLNYLEMVIKETLRLYPSVPLFGRKIVRETTIGRITVPEKTTVTLAPYFMGRDPNIYPDPLKFDPSRFDQETSNEKSNPYAFIPFSAGFRNCIGQKFAMFEVKSIVSKIIRNFELTIAKENEELALVAALVLRPQNGIILCAKARV